MLFYYSDNNINIPNVNCVSHKEYWSVFSGSMADGNTIDFVVVINNVYCSLETEMVMFDLLHY